MSNIIIIQTKENIKIKIEEYENFEDMLKQLEGKIEKLKVLYKEEKTPIQVECKNLTEPQMQIIQNKINEKIPVQINFITTKELGLSGIIETFEKEIITSQTKYYKGALRSGQKLEYEGSLVIIGDVNGGAEVIAGENIIVTGSLRGLAHAGAKGNKKAIINALEIKSPQIRIANIVKEIDQNDEEKKQFASLVNNEIILE